MGAWDRAEGSGRGSGRGCLSNGGQRADREADQRANRTSKSTPTVIYFLQLGHVCLSSQHCLKHSYCLGTECSTCELVGDISCLYHSRSVVQTPLAYYQWLYQESIFLCRDKLFEAPAVSMFSVTTQYLNTILVYICGAQCDVFIYVHIAERAKLLTYPLATD